MMYGMQYVMIYEESKGSKGQEVSKGSEGGKERREEGMKERRKEGKKEGRKERRKERRKEGKKEGRKVICDIDDIQCTIYNI
jgi:hypothetical protein